MNRDTFDDERSGCRSLVCAENGVIIAELVYRCIVCSSSHEFVGDLVQHYHTVHMKSPSIPPQTVITPQPHTLQPLSEYGDQYDDDENDYEPFSPVLVIDESVKTPTSTLLNVDQTSCTRRGYITCPICGNTRYYTTLQRRYGQFTCVGCYRFFREFYTSPQQYKCNRLGECPLDVRNKCRACWILSCSRVYEVDPVRKNVLNEYKPVNIEEFTDQTNATLPVNESQEIVAVKKQRIELDDDNEHTSQDDYLDKPFVINENYIDDSTVNGASLNLQPSTPLNGVVSVVIPVIKSGVKQPKQPKNPNKVSKGRIKNWCCLRCANCLADDCGKCINCLDRPKFGGKFIRKQRCVNKKCLAKL